MNAIATKCELVVIADEGGWFDTPIADWTSEESLYRSLAVSMSEPCDDPNCGVCHPDD